MVVRAKPGRSTLCIWSSVVQQCTECGTLVWQGEDGMGSPDGGEEKSSLMSGRRDKPPLE
jgi:hypothetical protein